MQRLLDQRLAAAFTAVAGRPVDPVLRRSQRADFQADGALALSRSLGRNPRDIAAEVLAAAELDDLCTSVDRWSGIHQPDGADRCGDEPAR